VATGIQIVFDAADPIPLAEFWRLALGYVEEPPPPGFDNWPDALEAHGIEYVPGAVATLVDPDGVGPRIYIQRVPEPKTAKNRMHLDVNAGGPRGTPPEERRVRVDAKCEELKGAGATELRRTDEHGEYYVVMQDPEGNEFCLQ
jgi:hypothetical protein